MPEGVSSAAEVADGAPVGGGNGESGGGAMGGGSSAAAAGGAELGRSMPGLVGKAESVRVVDLRVSRKRSRPAPVAKIACQAARLVMRVQRSRAANSNGSLSKAGNAPLSMAWARSESALSFASNSKISANAPAMNRGMPHQLPRSRQERMERVMTRPRARSGMSQLQRAIRMVRRS